MINDVEGFADYDSKSSEHVELQGISTACTPPSWKISSTAFSLCCVPISYIVRQLSCDFHISMHICSSSSAFDRAPSMERSTTRYIPGAGIGIEAFFSSRALLL